MSKPPVCSDLRSTEELITFAEFKLRHGDVLQTGQRAPYNPTLETLPYDPWYSLPHDKIENGIRQLCTTLLNLTRIHYKGDTEIANLNAALKSAQISPRGQSFYVAFLGDRGIGKSSLINAIFNRDLVNVSSSSSACTAFSTIIAYKGGAADDAGESDVRIQYLSEEEIRNHVEEQCRRYRFAFPRNVTEAQESLIPSEEPIGPSEIGVNEDEELEMDEAERQHVMDSGDTARRFFDIICGTLNDSKRKKWLDRALEQDDIETETFYSTCIEHAGQQLNGINAVGGFTQHDAVPDEQLEDVRKEAEKLWPLVKSLHILTGHPLLKNNICVLDLPGYGDNNHMRTALIDKFRDMAHFEIVVAPVERFVSNVQQNHYLSRSVRRLGAERTLLVANKSDQLLHDWIDFVRRATEEPILSLQRSKRRAQEIVKRAQAGQGTEADRLAAKPYNDYVAKCGRFSRIEHEENILKEALGTKRVDVLLVSARQYSLCMDTVQDEELPKITPEATGIPALRRYLLSLPAQTNYRTLKRHVFDTLPDIAKQIDRILTKFDEDVVYAAMRKDLAEQLPELREALGNLSHDEPQSRVVRPWDRITHEVGIQKHLDSFTCRLRHGIVYYSTLLKMLKENGIPVNGVALGRNLNEEILGAFRRFIDIWQQNTSNEIDRLAAALNAPVQNLLVRLQAHLNNNTIEPELRTRAIDALTTATNRIRDAYDALKAALRTRLHEIHILFTTEVNTMCPIALAMKPIYLDALGQRGGVGAYKRIREQLSRRLIWGDGGLEGLPSIMADTIASAQQKVWEECCGMYVGEAMAQLEGFKRITDELLDTQGFCKAEHRSLRDGLRPMLPGFVRSLEEVKREFPNIETADNSAVVKRKRVDDDDSAIQIE